MSGPTEKQTPGGNRASAAEITEQERIIAEAKRFATARARAAFVKNTLVRVGDGFILGQYSYTKHCADLDAVEALLDRMGAPQ